MLQKSLGAWICTLLLGSLISLADAAPPESSPEYPCYHLTAAPIIDGKADDAVWQQLPEAGGFFILGGKDYAIEKRTYFRAGWTDDSLYLCVKSFEPLPEKLKASPADGDALWADDAIELFFQPTVGPKYVQLITNSIGARWNAVGPENKETKPWNWTVRSGKWEKGWLLEIRIPFDVLGKTPTAGEKWPVNIARDITTGPAAEKTICWPPLQKGFNDRERFAQFIFRTEPATASQIKIDEARLNEPFYQYLKEQCTAKTKAVAEQVELRAALENPALAAEAKPIKEVLTQLTTLQARSDATPNEMVITLTTWRNLMELLSEKAKKLDIPLAKVIKLNLAFDIQLRQARDIKLWVNGQSITQQNGQWLVSLKEGVNIIALTVAGNTSGGGGLRLRIPNEPEMENRWRIGTASNDSWRTAEFDDRSWKKAAVDKDGYLSFPEGSTGDLCFRQIVLWGEHHYSGQSCLTPRVREWGFSQKSMETLFHILYSPLSFPLGDYEFILDVPKDFSLLAEKYIDDYQGGRINRRPQKVTVEEVQHNKQPFTRYRFSYEPRFVQAGQTECTLLPLILNEFHGENNTTQFYFHRLASDNVTELEQTLPVRILPPINGRMPKNVAIQQYISPWRVFDGGRLFPEHLHAVVQQALDAGFNNWFIGAWEGTYGKKVYDQVIGQGGSVALHYNSYPIAGNNLGTNSELGKWMQSTPETHARYFNETGDWNKIGQFCPSFVTDQGAAQFKKAVKADINLMLHGGTGQYVGFPKATIYWTDFEQVPWIAAGQGYEPAHTGDKSYCFCDNCKKAFRQYVKLPATTDLSDDAIFKNYKLQWSAFRTQLDGRVNGIVHEACNELGLQYSVYQGTHDQAYWMASKNKFDIAFPGCPGDGPADSSGQQYLDDSMTFFREKLGLSRITGQLFASSIDEGGSIGNANATNWEKDGFTNIQKVKTKILRVVATFHGGVDLNTSIERCAGQSYYIGQATRIISEYEDLFYSGDRADQLAVSEQIKYPNLLVLKKGGERLVLLFNEGSQPLRVLLQNKDMEPNQKAKIFGENRIVTQPEKMELSIEPQDVAVIHIQ